MPAKRGGTALLAVPPALATSTPRDWSFSTALFCSFRACFSWYRACSSWALRPASCSSSVLTCAARSSSQDSCLPCTVMLIETSTLVTAAEDGRSPYICHELLAMPPRNTQWRELPGHLMHVVRERSAAHAHHVV